MFLLIIPKLTANPKSFLQHVQVLYTLKELTKGQYAYENSSMHETKATSSERNEDHSIQSAGEVQSWQS